MSPALKDQLKWFENACRSQGLRLTPQRLEIFKELATATDHPSAENLYVRLVKKMPTLSLDTVYRTLGTFVQQGLVNKVETIESQARFEALSAQHHHLICQKCKQIIDFHWPSVDEAALPEEVQTWGEIERKNVTIYGTCQNCLKFF
ncbi:MAG: Fur family transcriptional regulator [Desulfuromusa sp.]|nr:Fur family transcriptional regulator [Desulfuromusa sp.]